MSDKQHKTSSHKNHSAQNPTVNPPACYEVLNAQIAKLDHILHALLQCRRQLEQATSEGCFDAQDLEWVDDQIAVYEQQKKAIHDKIETYERSVVKMEEILTKRRDILEQVDRETNLFTDCPELLKKFAQKSANLINMINKAKEDLQK
jgi:chromosome segregation ATPase